VSIARKWIFPILRLLVFAAIAAALVKLAFFADPGDSSRPDVPTADIIEPEVQVATGTIRNDIVLDATVNADAALPIRADLTGEIRRVSVTKGQHVDAGTEIMQILGQYPNGMNHWSVIVAGHAGVLSSFDALVGQMVGVGDVVGQVAPPSFNVTATLSPEQQYRLLNQPTEAEVAITGGPAPFTCTGLVITTPLPGTGGGGGGAAGGTGTDATGSGTTVSCSVPDGVTVFAGLAAKLTIAGGLAEDVLVVPMTAVEGASQTGVVYVIGAAGAEPEQREVGLGINDGVNVEITDGLEAGETILQFVPGAPSDPGGMSGGGPIFIGG
jgi:multidrug efflux pump subunit AcrA (membrane-fusion protein)